MAVHLMPKGDTAVDKMLGIDAYAGAAGARPEGYEACDDPFAIEDLRADSFRVDQLLPKAQLVDLISSEP
jgi:hypothetical protein